MKCGVSLKSDDLIFYLFLENRAFFKCMFYDLQYKRKIDRFREKEKLTNIDYNVYDGMRDRQIDRDRESEGEEEKLIFIITFAI